MANPMGNDYLQDIVFELELLAAKTLTFQLQLQEAMDASLAAGPSIQPSPLPSPSLIRVVLVIESEDSNVLDLAMTLMLEDIARFAMEYKDRELCETEMKKMKEELARRIHYQNFVNYIREVPEDEWKKYGDNYEKPYGKSSSFSSSSRRFLDSKCFKFIRGVDQQKED